jgi:hypothetical protein
MSQFAIGAWPAPRAGPFSAPMTGLVQSRMARKPSGVMRLWRMSSPRAAFSPPRSLLSAPAENIRPPPVRMRQATDGSSLSLSKTRVIASRVRRFCAFTGGRSKVTVAP